MPKTYKVCYLVSGENGIAYPVTNHGFSSLEGAEEHAEFVKNNAPHIRNSVKIYEE